MKIFLFVLALLLLLSIGGCSLEYKYSKHKYHFEYDIQALEQLTDYENLQDYLLFYMRVEQLHGLFHRIDFQY